jgi:beta-glucosidase
MVLLKNKDNILPLQREKLKSVAIIGPNAKVARIMAGGSAQVNPHYRVTPFEGVTAKLGNQVKIGFEQGCLSHKQLPLLDSNLLFTNTQDAEHGLTVEYFNGSTVSDSPAWTTTTASTELLWFSPIHEDVNLEQFSVRASGRFVPQESGSYTFSLVSAGLSRFFIDGQEVIDNWTQQTPGDSYFGMGSTAVTYTVELEARRSYALKLDYSKIPGQMLAAVRLGCLPPVPADALAHAVALAVSADVALVFAGLNEEWESEGFDRANLELPGEQNELIAQVAAANKKTIVVLNTGSAITMPWLDQVAAVAQAWYTGQECGNAIADVLFGDVNPSGKLTQTFPLRLEDTPAYINFPGENGKVYYGEGIFVGYRYYEKKRVVPLFPFGFGLSYTRFDYSSLRLSAERIGPHEKLQVEIDVTNTGVRAGKEVVQVYVRDPQARLQRPESQAEEFL